MPEPPRHYDEVASEVLAQWIERQGSEVWWNVDGDAHLTGRLVFPCPGDELADELRRIARPLQILTAAIDSDGRINASDELDSLVRRLGDNLPFEGDKPVWASNRYLVLRWQGSADEWLLVEDAETTKANRQDRLNLVPGREIR